MCDQEYISNVNTIFAQRFCVKSFYVSIQFCFNSSHSLVLTPILLFTLVFVSAWPLITILEVKFCFLIFFIKRCCLQ